MKPTLRLYELSSDYLHALDELTDQENLPAEAIADFLMKVRLFSVFMIVML